MPERQKGYNYFRTQAVRALLQLVGVTWEDSTTEQRALCDEIVEHISNYTRSRTGH